MPFEDKKAQFEKLLNKSNRDTASDKAGNNQTILPVAKNQSEKKESYNFTLYPSTHKKLKTIAKRQGYNSHSQFLDDLIEAIYSNIEERN